MICEVINSSEMARLLYKLTAWLADSLTHSLMNQLSQQVRQFSEFYGNRSFVAEFATARRLTQFWAKFIQPIPSYFISLKYVIIFTYIINQQTHINTIYFISFTIHRHVSVAPATINRVTYKNRNNMQQLHKMHD